MLAGEGVRLPPKCARMDENGNLPTCTQTGDGGWIAEYPDPDTGIPDGFAALFVLALLIGIAGTAWKVSTARRMARDAGMNKGDATAMTLLTDDGFEATYLASSLRQPKGATPGPAGGTTGRTTAERLRELDSLRAQGLVTEEEYAATRAEILRGL